MCRAITLILALALALLSGCHEERERSPEPAPDAPSRPVAASAVAPDSDGDRGRDEDQAQATDSDSARVDLYGRWERFADTPRRREEALERIAHLPSFGFGRAASAHDIALVDIDVMPDGTGLTEGSGSVAKGKTLFAAQCVQCHGADGRGADYEALVGREPREGFPFAESLEYTITVGNYWPYATTLFDYIQRAMPQAVPGSLPPDDVYSLVAYILYLNELVPEDAILDQDSLTNVVMPARDRFVFDDRRGGTELR